MEQSNYQGALQQPIGSGFTSTSTAADVIKGIDLKGKIAIVTGGNTGIGLETTKILATAGATVIVPARDLAKAKRNLPHIVNVELEAMDLMDTNSIDAFSNKFLASGLPLHLLVNIAGIMWAPLLINKGVSNRNWQQIIWHHFNLRQSYGRLLKKRMVQE